jgi:hypothetical protein
MSSDLGLNPSPPGSPFSLAAFEQQLIDVRFTPESGHVQCKERCPLCANSGHPLSHSITSSARASSEGGTVIPSAFAVLRLITVSYLVGAWTGKSAGFSPLRTRST